jgi:hypothetical protein
MISRKQKSFDTVKTFREIKEKISKDISDMSFEEFQNYINKHSLKINIA